MLRQSSPKSIKMVYCDKFSLSRGRKVKFLCVKMADEVAVVGKTLNTKLKITFSKEETEKLISLWGVVEEQVLLWHIK